MDEDQDQLSDPDEWRGESAFDDEATEWRGQSSYIVDEANDEIESQPSQPEVDNCENLTVLSYSGDKKSRKKCRHFSYSLITNAIKMGWEEIEIAKVIGLIAKTLKFDSAQLIRCLDSTLSEVENSSQITAIISTIIEEYHYSFSADQILCTMISTSDSNMNKFIRMMDNALECNLFDLSDDNTLTTLRSVRNILDQRDFKRYCKVICEHSNTKRACGHSINALITAWLNVNEGANLIHDIITKDFFLDLHGSTNEFLIEIDNEETREMTSNLLEESFKLDSDGDIVESDEDSEGNLKGFIVDSCSENSSADGENNEDEDEEEEDENDGDDRQKKRSKSSSSKSDSVNNNGDDKNGMNSGSGGSGGSGDDIGSSNRKKTLSPKKSTKIKKKKMIIEDDDDDD